MDGIVATENLAWLGRVTCGWKKPALALEDVLRYWRDVHSPAIARRPGIWEYRHFQFAPVDTAALAGNAGIETSCPSDQQLMWTSDVRYASAEALDAFSAQPDPQTRNYLLADIELIVDQSTTYRVVEELGRTFVDHSGNAQPQGEPATPTYSLFLRQRGDEAAFRDLLTKTCAEWAADPAVIRLRLALFEAPDMEAERKSGYPIKTHPTERQYQAWIDLSLRDAADLTRLVSASDLACEVTTLHAYPVRAVYTSNQAGRPTFVGLRGYPAFAALKALGGKNQAAPELLEWMYGPAAQGVVMA